jgi:1D-myo-inositol-tetrakisphosphate 5-kinase/inositol-polyphosphate multikinase
MDDAAYGFSYPAVADFKLGRVTHDPEASPDKIHHHRSRYPPAERLGFQLIGMRVFNSKDKTFTHFDKVFGRALTEDSLIHGLALYFQFHEQPQMRVIREAVRKFEEVKGWFEKQRTYHFYASSLIVVYEACWESLMNEMESGNRRRLTSGDGESKSAAATANDVDLNNNVEPFIKIFMADFAHVFPANNSLDVNYLFGLDKLIEYLKRLLSPDYTFVDMRGCVQN